MVVIVMVVIGDDTYAVSPVVWVAARVSVTAVSEVAKAAAYLTETIVVDNIAIAISRINR
jgi:hypothetical protein